VRHIRSEKKRERKKAHTNYTVTFFISKKLIDDAEDYSKSKIGVFCIL